MVDPELDAAYRATVYEAIGPTGELRLRVDEPSKELDALLRQVDMDCWAFLTGWNPGSRPTDAEQNARANEALARDLAEQRALDGRELFVLVGQGRGLNGEWPPEESFLALGLTLESAVELAAAHGQAALVAGTLGQPPRLVWVRSPG